MLAIWLRNTMLNQTVLVLALGGALMVPWAIWFTLTSLVGHPTTRDCVGLRATAPVLTTIATTLILIASAVAGQQLRRFNLPPERRATVAGEMLGQGGVIFTIVVARDRCRVAARRGAVQRAAALRRTYLPPAGPARADDHVPARH